VPKLRGTKPVDAISFLQSDHRRIESGFRKLDKARDRDRKSEVALKVCEALRIHTQIEEEIFYPAFLAVTGDRRACHQAEVEHDGLRTLIAEIEQSSPREIYFDARVHVLFELLTRRIEQEEKPGGVFAIARKSSMDQEAVGKRLRARKRQLEGDPTLINLARSQQPRQTRARVRDRVIELAMQSLS
jgi:hemerythrin superfamily protein